MLKKRINIFYLILSLMLWVATFFWMIFIFILSNESGNVYDIRMDYFSTIIDSYLKVNVSVSYLRYVVNTFQFGFLAFIMYYAMSATDNISEDEYLFDASESASITTENETYILFTFWFTILYAVIDEYHQLFIYGREGRVTDLIIDAIAIVVVLVIIRFAYVIRTKFSSDK